ncbi:putative arabinogalactan protein/22/41 [Helianthus annuus]|nr:putative arabinogalactan protein/22/41 [Helianthus annuus]
MNSRSVAVAFIGFVFMALFGVNRAQEFAPVPVPGNDGAAIDQGVAYLLLLVALAITYLRVVFGLVVLDNGGWG